MANKKTIQSVEPNIADMANNWLKSYTLDYKLEQEPLNNEIDKALNDYYSKNGGSGGNRPDCKLLLQDSSLNYFPVLIEYKGYKDKLVKLDEKGQIDNRTNNNEPNFKNINSYAVNGAVHYANALLHHTSYTDIIAIGITGYKDESEKIQHQVGVYYVSKSNFGVGQIVDNYSDLSFLKPGNFDTFTKKLKTLNLSQQELDSLKEQREKEIEISLKNLNQHIYDEETGLDVNDRVYLVSASIIATIGIPGKVAPLEKSDLKSSSESGNTDGEIIVRKLEAFLKEKNLPKEKKDLIIRTLSNTLLTGNINRAYNGESQLKRVFTKIVDDLGIYYKIGLTTDFTGKLFNQMYSWIPMPDDKKNDVVLTPPYVSKLLVKLARVNKDSYVWDFATGSAGLLVAAMNEMLIDAKNTITSPEQLIQKELKIKSEQLLGIEHLSSIYMLAILNMILMGDGSSNILNKDSLKDFDGKYGFGNVDDNFPADAFILNPPYSTAGEKALNMMKKGYAAIIIQNSAGSGKAKEFNKRILQKHTLLASIKMPIDIFIGKSSVQTNIYVFKVSEKHHKDEIVKFVDFSNDGYTRANRKKAKVSSNLKDTDKAKERYEEIVNLVRFGKTKLKIFTEKEYYEGTIDPENGADWNQTTPLDTKPTLKDFKKTVSDYLAWEVSNILKNQDQNSDRLGK
jgi:N-6 DNA Methylase